MQSNKESLNKTETKILFSNKLSLPIKDENSLFANVTRTKWKAPDGKIVYFVRLELKLFRGQNPNPLSISLTGTQFEWICQCISQRSGNQTVPAEREGKYLCYEVPETIFGTTIISTIEKKSKFGIVLDIYEVSMLSTDSNILSFIIKFQSTTGEKLKELTRYIYCATIIHFMNEIIADDCFGCDKSLKDQEHSCKEDPRKLIDIHFDESVSNKELIGKKFVDLFNYFCKLLSIDESNRIQGNEQMMIIEKAQKKDLLSTLLDLKELSGTNKESKSIMRLIQIKDNDGKQITEECNEQTGNCSQPKRQKI